MNNDDVIAYQSILAKDAITQNDKFEELLQSFCHLIDHLETSLINRIDKHKSKDVMKGLARIALRQALKSHASQNQIVHIGTYFSWHLRDAVARYNDADSSKPLKK